VEWAAAGPEASAGLRPTAVQKVTGIRDEGGADGLPQMGLAQLERKFFFHFLNLISNAKTFPRNPRKCFKAQKILKKFQKFQENSQS
jgi:hypothetical protein